MNLLDASAAVVKGFAEQSTDTQALLTANNIWMMVSIFLVFIMHLGFATVESGFTQAKNTTNILFKNTVIPAIGLLTYAGWGFKVMYPGDAWLIPDVFAWDFGVGTGDMKDAFYDAKGVVYAGGGYTYWTDFLFQGMFAATAATIVSGAVAERVKLGSFMIFSVIFVGVIYPIIGSWHWGVGFLNKAGFYDFAGSTLVHSVGGWGALAGAIVLGPRIGKYVDGKVFPIAGHNLPLATIGVFLLWLGWFGFNGGSVLSGDPNGVSFVLVTTCLAAAAGAIGAAVAAYFVTKKADLGMALNGILAGLVGITAGADVISPTNSVWVGLISGIVCVFAVIFFDKMKIDDPVGAISVHLVCGILGTLFVAIFGFKAGENGENILSMGAQLKGIAAAAGLAFPAAFIIFFVLKKTIGLRVSKEEEVEGLDINEHGTNAYEI